MENNLNNKKLLVFDIDSTLCDINKPIEESLVKVIRKLSHNYQIVFASGKPSSYITGFIRQVGVKDSIIIGENGATIMYNSIFPPQAYYKISVSDKVESHFTLIKQRFLEKFNNKIWFQPNDVNLTIFPLDISKIKEIHDFAKEFETLFINTYYHKDSVDFTPKGFDKGTAVTILLNKLKIEKENLYVFGDASNDLPMLLLTENSFLVKSSMKEINPLLSFNSYLELENYLEFFFKKEIKND